MKTTTRRRPLTENATARQRDLRRRFQQFHGKTGGVVGQAASYALQLANAQRALDRAVGLGRAEVAWDADLDADYSWANKRDMARFQNDTARMVLCAIKIDGEWCASLGGIHELTGTQREMTEGARYRRQVEAELALECLDKLQAVTRYKVRGEMRKNPSQHPDSFTRSYIQTALWASTGDDGRPLDDGYQPSDIDLRTLNRMVADCARFQRENEENLSVGTDSRGGHDFWLTRNGHGAGFWDGDWPEPAGDALTEAARAFGSFDLYVGDDGKIHAI